MRYGDVVELKKGKKPIVAQLLEVKETAPTGVHIGKWIFISQKKDKPILVSSYTYSRKRDAVRGLKRAYSIA
jgi:hypothetical protein